MELTFECPGCQTVTNVSAVEANERVACRACGETRPVRASAFGDGGLSHCPLCATEDLYLQKDFPQGLGLAIVVVGFVVSTVYWYFDQPIPALGVLLVSALVDMALYHIVPDVTICYRCLSQYRGAGTNPEGRFRPFDLSIGERYRQERLRIQELKGRTTPPGATPPVSR